MSRIRQYLATAVATIGGFALGTVLGWTSPAFPQLIAENATINETEYEVDSNELEISKEELSWIGSIATLGALVACPIAGIIVEKLGRKSCILIFTIPFTLGYIILSLSFNVWMLYVGRFITGLCGGAFSLVLPIYLSEIADDDIRGVLSSGFHLMLTIGILFTYVIGTVVSWQILSVICSIPPLILLGLMFYYIPESPRFYLSVEKVEEATKALAWFQNTRSPKEIEAEIETMNIAVRENELSFWKILKKRSVRLPFTICLILMLIEQLTAFEAVIFYTSEIFSAAGLNDNANLQTIGVGAIQVLAVFVSEFFVDKVGRRTLLIYTHSIMTISLIVMGVFFYFKKVFDELPEDDPDKNELYSFSFVPMSSMAIYIISYSIGIGPLSWTLLGELLPPNAKGKCSAIATALMWLLAFGVTKCFDNMKEEFGMDWTFVVFGLFCGTGTYYILFYLPETRGKTLEEIQALFSIKTVNVKPKVDESLWRKFSIVEKV